MAVEDIKGKKRKGAQDAAPKAKKPRKSDADDVVAATEPAEAAPVFAAEKGGRRKAHRPGKPNRKTAADFFSDEDEAPATEPAAAAMKPTKGKKQGKAAGATNSDAAEVVADVPIAQEKPKKQGKKVKVAEVEEALVVEAPQAKVTKAKTGKKVVDTAPVEEDATSGAQDETPAKKPKKTKGGKKQAEPVEEVAEVAVVSEEVDGEVEEDDQTAALLAGFESDTDDENDPEEDDDFEEGATVPALSKKQKTALEKASKGPRSNEPGVIYIGRIPRGFFEAEMKKYFSQFGRVTRLRLSRNKKTGASKHYAFVEFASTEVADIVARTMNNYLLFGHILKVKLIPAEQVHPDLFKGAGKRFKVNPLNKKVGLAMERGADRATWEKRVETETKRRARKKKTLKEEFGYEFDAPPLKGVDTVPMQLANGDPLEQLPEAPVEDAPAVEVPKPKRGKKAAKAVVDEQPTEVAESEPAPAPAKKGKKSAKSKLDVEADVQAEIAADVAAPTPEKKAKKDKKRKSDVADEPVAAEPAPKSKKAKKEAKPAVPAVVEEEVVEDVVVEKKHKVKPEGDAVAAKPKKAKKAKA